MVCSVSFFPGKPGKLYRERRSAHWMSFAAQDSAWRHLLPTDARFGDPVAKGFEFTVLALALKHVEAKLVTNIYQHVTW